MTYHTEKIETAIAKIHECLDAPIDPVRVRRLLKDIGKWSAEAEREAYARGKADAAPQASAEPTRAMLDGKPLDGEFAKVMADKFDEICIRPAAEDSAKGAGDVVAWTNDAGDIEPISDAVKQALPDLCAKHYTRPLAFADRQQRGGEVDERVAFEASERNRPGYGEDTLAVYTQDAGEYALPLTQARWVGWQARAALAAQPAASAGPVAWLRWHKGRLYIWDEEDGAFPVYAAPLAAHKPDGGDAKDAERYRWLRVNANTEWEAETVLHLAQSGGRRLDEAIDAAMSSQQRKGK